MEYFTPEEQEIRLNICKECDRFSFREDGVSYCASSNLDINLVISTVDIDCPLEKF
jgi:hypothetical protein